MRSLRLPAILASFAILYQVAGVRAYPSPASAVLLARDNNNHELQLRAPPVSGSITIPLSKESNHNTWTGHRAMPGLGGATVPDQVVRDTAYLTYTAFENMLPSPGLVAVIYVPGGGWAAGSVWHGSDEAFKGFAGRTNVFWWGVPVESQQLDPNLNGVHKWHAEAVAAAKAETEFEAALVDGLWPEGTKIYAYGKYWDKNKNRYEVGSKAVCRDGRSQVAISCKQWAERINIDIVPVPNA